MLIGTTVRARTIDIIQQQVSQGQDALQIQLFGPDVRTLFVTAQDVIDLLHERIEALRAKTQADAIQKARALGYLAELARKAIETGDLVVRLDKLEAACGRTIVNDAGERGIGNAAQHVKTKGANNEHRESLEAFGSRRGRQE